MVASQIDGVGITVKSFRETLTKSVIYSAQVEI
jgi:hypothetical protein